MLSKLSNAQDIDLQPGMRHSIVRIPDPRHCSDPGFSTQRVNPEKVAASDRLQREQLKRGGLKQHLIWECDGWGVWRVGGVMG